MIRNTGRALPSGTEGVSTAGQMRRAKPAVMSAFAQLERDQLAERTRAGMAAAAEHGPMAGGKLPQLMRRSCGYSVLPF